MTRSKKPLPRHKRTHKEPEIVFAPAGAAPDPELRKARWRRDKVSSLPEGISLVPDGKAAYIYARTGRWIVPVYAELSGNPAFDMVLFLREGGLSRIDSDTLEEIPLNDIEASGAIQELRSWLTHRGIRYSL